mgnify:FL=1
MNDPVEDTDVPTRGVLLEPRCRVCRNDAVRQKVNDMLAVGSSYAMVARAMEPHNTSADPCDRVTINSVRNHSARHFPVQSAAQATYRAILERRAEENRIDFINGVTAAITPIAYYETVMVKGYEALVSPDTRVDVGTAMAAAAKLQALTDAHAGQVDAADIIARQNRIIAVIHDFVPAEKHTELVARIEGAADQNNGADGVVSDEGIRDFDPDLEVDDDDD